MTRCCLFMLLLAGFSQRVADAQHHHGHQQHSSGGSGYGPPIVMMSGHSHYSGGGGFLGRHGSGYGRMLVPAYVSQPTQVAYYPNPIDFFPTTTPWTFGSFPPPASQPTAAARLKSLDLQIKGDQKMREQKWSEARAAYASSITAVPNRAEAHFRLAICFATIQRFEMAIREFKRALALDPHSVKTAKTLKMLMGPDSQIVRASIISKLQEWTREDVSNSDRQFLLGAMHYLNDDAEGRGALETALKLKGAAGASHILRFLDPMGDPINGQFAAQQDGVPALNNRAVPPFGARPITDLRFPRTVALNPLAEAPVPMPEGLVPLP